MYKSLALFNGVILAVMIFFNGMLSAIIGPFLSTLVYQLTGLTLILIVSRIFKNKFPDLRKLPCLYFLPGILGVLTILLNNISIPHIGVTLAAGSGLFGQLLMSAVVEHYGLFGMPVNRLGKGKIVSFSIISLGIVMMVTL